MTGTRDDNVETIGGTVIAYVDTMLAAVKNPRHQEQNLSHAEVQFAEALRSSGIQFEQQKHIGTRWADFWLPELRVAVEIDGAAFHGDAEAEARRDEELLAHGAHVIHIRAAEVFSDPDAAVARVQHVIVKLTGVKR